MNEIDRRAFFASLLGAAVTAGVAVKIPGLQAALEWPRLPIQYGTIPPGELYFLAQPFQIGDLVRVMGLSFPDGETYQVTSVDPTVAERITLSLPPPTASSST